MKDHKIIKTQLQDYLEDLLTASDRQELESHLTACAECRRELEELNKLVTCLDALPEQEPPADLTTLIMARVREESVKVSLWDMIRGWLPKLGYAYGIGLVLISLIGYMIYRQISSSNINVVKAFNQTVVFVSTGFAKLCELMQGLWIAGSSLLRYGLPTISTCLLIETLLILAGISYWYFRRQKAMYLFVIK
jgi:predicted anti-sigma-YlaC factor YlaD